MLIGAGTADAWFTAAAAGDDANRLAAAAIPHQVIQFAGGHEWTDEFRDAARVWLNAPGGPER